jgi:hypothetical protein
MCLAELPKTTRLGQGISHIPMQLLQSVGYDYVSSSLGGQGSKFTGEPTSESKMGSDRWPFGLTAATGLPPRS